MTTDRDQSDSAASQGVPETTKNWKRQRIDSPLETPEGVQPAALGMWTSGLQNCENKFLLFSATQFVVIC